MLANKLKITINIDANDDGDYANRMKSTLNHGNSINRNKWMTVENIITCLQKLNEYVIDKRPKERRYTILL